MTSQTLNKNLIVGREMSNKKYVPVYKGSMLLNDQANLADLEPNSLITLTTGQNNFHPMPSNRLQSLNVRCKKALDETT